MFLFLFVLFSFLVGSKSLQPVSTFPVQLATHSVFQPSLKASQLLTKIEQKLAQYKQHVKKEDLVDVYLAELELLHELGILRSDNTVFSFLSGADLFPGLYTKEMWSSDFRFDNAEIFSQFSYFHDLFSGKRIKSLPSILRLGHLKHDSKNAMEKTFIRVWTSNMKPGDVVFLKFTLEYLTLYFSQSKKEVLGWIERLVENIPDGVTLVIYDQMRPPSSGFRTPLIEGLGEFLSQSGHFNVYQQDQSLSFFWTRFNKIQAVKSRFLFDQVSTPLTAYLSPVSLALGGKMTLLVKSSPLVKVPLRREGLFTWSESSFSATSL